MTKRTHRAIVRTLDGLERIETFAEAPNRYIETFMAYARPMPLQIFPKRRYERTRETLNGLPIYLECEPKRAKSPA